MRAATRAALPLNPPRKRPRDPHTLMPTIITEKDFHQQENAPVAKIVKFVNFSNEPFTWTWNKVPYTFLPSNGNDGNEKYMERPIAIHFATHLVNRELHKAGRESDTSPKKPDENPFFMRFFKRCIQEVDMSAEPMDRTKMEQEIIDRNIRTQLNNVTVLVPPVPMGVKTAGTKATPKRAVKKVSPETANPTPEEIAKMTGQSVHKPRVKPKPASEADKDFQTVEGPDSGTDDGDD